MQFPKAYLDQARFIDLQINSKLRQLDILKADIQHATQAGASFAAMVDLQHDLNGEIDLLVETKKAIGRLIGQVANPHYRALLEMRYLCFDTWEVIAEALHYDVRWVHVLHGRALQEVGKLMYPSGCVQDATPPSHPGGYPCQSPDIPPEN